ncbi:MAG: MinD/ParA family protein [Magnetococcales bacterium]|nr:MinD/ParA family protein [Magnetococcales bacterium]
MMSPLIEELDNQAATLKELVRKASREGLEANAPPRLDTGAVRQVPLTLAVTSGKGGVGKTLVSVNLATQFASMGLRVLVLDADLGLANIDVVLGLTPEFTIQDVLDGHKTLPEVAIPGPMGITILPAASGVAELSNLSESQRMLLLDHMDHWNADFDVVVVDTGAGISPNVRYFILAVERILVVATPDPASITDAYALMKVMYLNHRIDRFTLLVNQARSEREGLEVYRTVQRVADRFLNIGLDYAGFVPSDPYVTRAVRQQKTLLELYPTAQSVLSFAKISQDLLKYWRENRQQDGRLTFFGRRSLPGSA